MVADAEAHAEEDRKFHELVDARNKADNLVHATEKSLSDLGDKVEAAERGDIESAVSDLREAIKGDDKDVIDTKYERLSELHGKLAERMYQKTTAPATWVVMHLARTPALTTWLMPNLKRLKTTLSLSALG